MVKKKTDEKGETTESVDGQPVETAAGETSATDAKPKRGAKRASASEQTADAPSLIDSVVDTVTAAAGVVIDTVSEGVANVAEIVTGSPEKKVSRGKRAEKIGVVASDKMTKTVVVRVDRLVKHPIYRKYIRKRNKFMAHDEMGAKMGDKVRIVETRPLSARKRWRVVEIIQKAEL